MKRILYLLIILSASHSVFSQDGEMKRGEKVKQLKIAYITEELNLTVAESEKFWPLYNEMEEKIKVKRRENRRTAEEMTKNSETYSDDDFKKSVNKLFDNEIAETNLKKEYYGKIAGVIGYKKATRLLKIEKEFKKKLVKELKQRKGGRH
ncbi:MAG: hypothetical protein K0R65_1094 [Crocinitomicaceae bacterium]|jgi:hypothetical protein|nr:hypothetical protein [Crocinitomicaceae bacterium]